MCRGFRLWVLLVASVAGAACGRSGVPFDPLAGDDPSIPRPERRTPGALDLPFGTGADGVATVSTNVNLTVDSLVGRACGDAPWYPVTALSASVATLATAPGACLAEGDEVLLLNVLGATLSTANAGVFESLRVAAVSGTSASFTTPKRFFYGASVESDDGIGLGTGEQRVVLQRVPNYQALVVGSAWELSVSAFAGSGGGILAVRVLETAEIAGEIDVSGRGYRGGIPGGRRAERIVGAVSQGGGGGGGGSGGHNGTNVCGASGLGADGARNGYCGNVTSTAYSPCPATPNMCSTNGCGGAATGAGGGGGAGYGFSSATGGASPGLGGAGGNKAADVGQAGGTAMLPGFAGGGGSGGRDSGGGGGGGQPYDSFPNESPAGLSRLYFGGGAAAGGGGGGGGGAGDFQCATGGSGGAANGTGGARGTDNCAAADSTIGAAGTAGGAGGGVILLYADALTVTGGIRADGGPGGSGGAGGNGAAIGGCSTGRGGGGGGGGGGARGAAGGAVLLFGGTLDLGADRVRASGGAGGAGGGGGTAGTNAGIGGAGAGGSGGAPGVIAVHAIDAVTGTTVPSYSPLTY